MSDLKPHGSSWHVFNILTNILPSHVITSQAAELAAALERCTLKSLDVSGHHFSLELVQALHA